MSLISNALNSSPYFDDFSPTTKDFLRVLFKPGYAVQAREMNQLQAILQTQVQRLGNTIFQDGSLIIGGQTTLDVTTVKYLKLVGNTQAVANFIGQTITGSSGASGTVVAVDTTDLQTLIYRPLNGISFVASEVVTVTGSLSAVTVAASAFNGSSSTVSIDSGIFYTQGIFTICPAQTIYLDKLDNTPSKKVGLVATVNTINSTQDSTLLDNANGSYNYAAPGADRLQLTLTLTAFDPTSTTNASTFIQLLLIQAGIIQQQITGPSYSQILDLLATRTYDTNGDFIVNPFIANAVVNSTGATGSTFNLNLSAGKAFVQGYEIATIAKQAIVIDKARTTSVANSVIVPVTYGNYITVTLTKALPNIGIGSSGYVLFYLYDSVSPYTAIGTCKIRSMAPTSTTNQYNLYLFDINITTSGKTFYNVGSIGDNATQGSAVSLMTIVASGATGPIMNFPASTALNYNTGYDVVAGATGTILNYYKSFTSVVTAGVSAVLSLNSGESFVSTSSSNFVVSGATGPQLTSFTTTPSGSSVYFNVTASGFTGSGTINVNGLVQNTATTANSKVYNGLPTRSTVASQNIPGSTITFNTYPDISATTFTTGYNALQIISGTGSGTTVYPLAANVNTKTLTSATPSVFPVVDTTSICTLCPTFTPGSSSGVTPLTNGLGYVYSATGNANISLGVTDALKIVKIITNTKSGNVAGPNYLDWFDTTADVTSRYILDNGQRNDYYDFSTVTLAPGQSPVNTPIAIFFEYFSHTIGAGYFNRNSYSNANNPQYYQDSNSINANLFNTIDIRPTKTSNAAPYFASQNMPASLSNFTTNLTYYLPRIDKIVVTSDGKFLDVKGTPSPNPTAPADIANSLDLYTMFVPAYTFSPNAITLTSISNKRYTMNDIAGLDNRISNLEYYASLSALENSASSFIVKDSNGTSRFNNSLLVDSFTGSNIVDSNNTDNHCSIDITDRELRPSFLQRSYNLSYVSGSGATGPTVTGGILTAAYSGATAISQNQASIAINVNPFLVFDWQGTLDISPNNDNWPDLQVSPVNVTSPNGVYDNFHPGAVNPNGSLYNQWNSMWYGVNTVTTYENNTIYVPVTNTVTTGGRTDTVLTTFPISQAPANWPVQPGNTSWTINSNISVPNPQLNPATLQPIPIYTPDGVTATWTPDSGFYTGPLYQTTYTQPTSVATTTEIVPTQVTQAVTTSSNVPSPPPINLNQIQVGNLVQNVVATQFIRSRNITFTATGMKPFTTVKAYFDGNDASSFITNAAGTFGGTLTTNAAGSVTGKLSVSIGVYYTGSNIFLLTDGVAGDRKQESTGSQTTYTCTGLPDPAVILNTPAKTVDSTSAISASQNQPQTKIYPLAQTFYIDSNIYSEGMFVSALDLFFAKADATLPLTVQIRDTVNGFPSPTSILGSISVPASSILPYVDTTGTTPVKITFVNPIYLSSGTEYCIVLIANSTNYEPWAAQIGKSQVSTAALVSQKPYVGNVFRTQNASSWIADLTTDLTFNLYRCNFYTGNYSTTWSDYNTIGAVPVDTDNIVTVTTTQGSTGATLYFNDIIGAGLVYGSFVGGTTLGATGSTGAYGATGSIPANTTILSSSPTSGSITLSQYPLYTIPIGTPITFYRKSQGYIMPTALMIPDQTFNPFSSTTIAQSYIGSTGYAQIDSTYNTITPNKNYDYPTQGYSIQPAGESFKKKINFTLSSPYVSPVINTSRQSVVQIMDVINNISGFNTTLSAALGSTGVVVVTALGATGTGVSTAVGATNFGPTTPSSGVIINGAEQILITAALGATGITITRGYNNTTPAATGANANLVLWTGSIPVNSATNIYTGDIIQFGAVGATGAGSGFVPGFEQMQVISGGKTSGAATLSVLRGYNGATGYGATGINAGVNDITQDETQPTGGGAFAKYITRPVTLSNNSSYIKVYLTSNKPALSNVLVYYKVLSATDSSTLASKSWNLMTQVSPILSTVSTDPTIFQEYQFLPGTAYCTGTTPAITYTSNNITYNNFIKYAIKIVMLSSNTTAIPLVSDLRIMVLQ